jgi:hypothetical protein
LEGRRVRFNGQGFSLKGEKDRFVLPPRFVKGAQIADQLYFQGAGAEFLIFNPAELMKLPAADWRHAQLACEDLAEQVLAKARK